MSLRWFIQGGGNAGGCAEIGFGTGRKKKYASVLCERGVSPEKIWKYGFVFKGKEVLIGDNTSL